MADPPAVLLLEEEAQALHDATSRLARLGVGTRALENKDLRTLEEGELRGIRVVLLSPRFGGDEVGELLDRIRTLTTEPGLEDGARAVVIGMRPEDAVRTRLRDAGVAYALWEPYDDGALRFVMNGALAPDGLHARDELRVPTTLLARVQAGERRKNALVYNLSENGAFLETARPSVRGARIRVEIPLPDATVELEARVVFTNVPGNLQRPNLPHGMGVRFMGVSDEARDRLRAYVAERAPRYRP